MSHGNAIHRRDTEMILPEPKSLLHQHGMLWERANLLQKLEREASSSGTIQTLLVPLDGTPQAEHALPYAVSIARRSGALVRLVHVHSRLDRANAFQLLLDEESPDPLASEKQEYLRSVTDRVHRAGAAAVETILIDSLDTVESLSQVAAGSDLVVMASRRRGFWRRFFSYSVADELRRRLSVPMLLVRSDPSPVDLSGDPVARHVLVSLDGSVLDEKILESAKAMGRSQNEAVTLLNVQDHDWASGTFEHTNPTGYLLGVTRETNCDVPKVEAAIMTTNRPIAEVLASFAEERGADLIAVAVRRDAGWTRWLHGNAVDVLLRRTDLPILTLTVDHGRERSEVTGVIE